MSMKKIVSIVLSVVMSISLYTSVSASPAYDVNAAMEYAAKHVNDNDGSECAEFVSKCVQAGGLNIPIKTGTKGCWDAILDASGLSGKNLTLNEKGYIIKSKNENLLERGDVVIQWCYTCDLRPHILICGGYDSEGYATFYAHNDPLDNKRYNFSKNSQHEASCNIGAKAVQLSKLSNNVPSDGKSTSDNDTKVNDTSSKQKCGDNAYWVLDNNGTLTISGSGEMYDQKNNVIFSSFPSDDSIVTTQSVKNIIIEDGITKIGEYAFVQMKNVKTVSIPISVQTIEMGAFFYVTPDSITYAGSKGDWDKITINGQQSTMALGSHFFNALSFKDNNGTKRTNIFASSTGKSYKIEAYKNGNLVSTANISPDGYPESFSGDTQYPYFRPLYTNVNNVTCGDLPFGNITFKYENGKIIEVIGDENEILKRYDLNVEQSYIGYTWAPSLNYNSNNCIIESSYGSEIKCWEYDESGRLKTYYVKGMAPTYYFYYDASGRLNKCEIAGPGSVNQYTFKYVTDAENGFSSEQKVSILINNKFLKCEQPPVLINGRTLVPMRTIFEALGADVSWNGQLRTATGTKDGKTVSFTIDKNTITINGNDHALDVPAQLINDKTMIPARAVAEAFDCDVNWNQAKQYVIITPRNQIPYRIEVLDEQNAVIATAHFDEKGRMYQINTNNYLWLFPLYANINGNTFDEPIPFGKESFIEYDAENKISKVKSTDVIVDSKNNTEKEYPVDYLYKYNDTGLCESVNIVYTLEPDKNKMITYTYADYSTRSSNYSNVITSFNAIGLLEKHHTIGQGTVLKCTYDEFNNLIEKESLSSGITYFRFNYNDYQQLTDATYESLFGNKHVTYRYINE